MNSNDFMITSQHTQNKFLTWQKKSAFKRVTYFIYFLETFYKFSDFFWCTVRTLIKTQVLQMSYYLLKNFKWGKKDYKEEKEQ